MLALANSDLPVFEYSPREIKKAAVGRGGASKEQVQFMIHSIFGMEGSSETYDVTDGVAVALCHAHRRDGPLGDGGRRKNDLESKLKAAGAYDQRSNRLREKLEAMGVAPGPRHVQVKPKRRGR